MVAKVLQTEETFDTTLCKISDGNIKKKLWPLFMDRVQLPQGYRATSRGNLLFTTKFSEIPGTHFINLGRMKGCVDLGPSGLERGTPGLETQRFNH